MRQTPNVYFILVASLVFYSAWNYKFIPLLAGSAVGDYFFALAIAGASPQWWRALNAKPAWRSAGAKNPAAAGFR